MPAFVRAWLAFQGLGVLYIYVCSYVCVYEFFFFLGPLLFCFPRSGFRGFAGLFWRCLGVCYCFSPMPFLTLPVLCICMFVYAYCYTWPFYRFICVFLCMYIMYVYVYIYGALSFLIFMILVSSFMWFVHTPVFLPLSCASGPGLYIEGPTLVHCVVIPPFKVAIWCMIGYSMEFPFLGWLPSYNLFLSWLMGCW